MGALFNGWILFQCMWWILGWEAGIDKLIHHVIFLIPAIVGQYYHIMAELVVFAISMETSTPALAMMLLTRQVEGHERAVAISGGIFSVLFLVIRIFVYGYGLARSWSFWVDPPSSALAELGEVGSGRRVAVVAMQAIFSAGWLLQLFWARTIAARLYGVISGRQSVHGASDRAVGKDSNEEQGAQLQDREGKGQVEAPKKKKTGASVSLRPRTRAQA